MDAISADAKAQVIATVIIGFIAVWGSIRGAIRGAEVGAKATRDATKQAIDAQRKAAQEEEQEERSAVRLLLSLEIDHNLDTLRTLWDELTREPPRNYSSDPDKQRRQVARDRAHAFLASPPLVWSRKAWDGLTPQLPHSLSRVEIEQANLIFSGLDTISGIRAQLAAMDAEQPRQEVNDSPIQHRPVYHTVYPQSFNNNAPFLWERIEAIVEQLLSDGNPIAEQEEGEGRVAPPNR